MTTRRAPASRVKKAPIATTYWYRLVDGTVARTDDLTVGEMCEIEKATGKSWVAISPLWAVDAREVFVQLLARTVDVDTARQSVNSWTMEEIGDRIRMTPTADPPKEWAVAEDKAS